MDANQRTGQEQYTILRIKRKRNEEPLDALGECFVHARGQYILMLYLVVESSAKRKKAKGGMNVFQFAETVEQDAWEDEKQKEDLQVSRLT